MSTSPSLTPLSLRFVDLRRDVDEGPPRRHFKPELLPPTDRCAIKGVRSVRQENVLLPGSQNPCYSLFPASLSHDRMIGPKSPCNAGGLVGRHTLSCRKANQGGGAMPELFVGVDVAKDSSSAKGIDSSGKGRFSLTLRWTQKGSCSYGRQSRSTAKISRRSSSQLNPPPAITSTSIPFSRPKGYPPW
jgi:hypothetical protein